MQTARAPTKRPRNEGGVSLSSEGATDLGLTHAPSGSLVQEIHSAGRRTQIPQAPVTHKTALYVRLYMTYSIQCIYYTYMYASNVM